MKTIINIDRHDARVAIQPQGGRMPLSNVYFKFI